MGRRIKTRSNPALGRAIKKGDNVALTQLLVHQTYGAIAYVVPQLWRYHYQFAMTNADDLRNRHLDVLALEPGPNGMRLIPNDDLLTEVYDVGGAMVSNSVRAAQHFAQYVEHVFGAKLQGATVQERINDALVRFASDSLRNDPDYTGLSELSAIRDAIEHPKIETVTTGDVHAWDQVPLAWFVSERSLESWDRFSRWFDRVIVEWEGWEKRQPIRQQTLTMERGIESRLQVKKLPR